MRTRSTAALTFRRGDVAAPPRANVTQSGWVSDIRLRDHDQAHRDSALKMRDVLQEAKGRHLMAQRGASGERRPRRRGDVAQVKGSGSRLRRANCANRSTQIPAEPACADGQGRLGPNHFESINRRGRQNYRPPSSDDTHRSRRLAGSKSPAPRNHRLETRRHLDVSNIYALLAAEQIENCSVQSILECI